MQFVKVSGHTDVDLDGFSQNCSLVRVINCMLVAMLSIGVACDVTVLLLPLFLGRMLWLRPCRWSRINSKIPSTKGKIKIHIIRHLLCNLALHCGFLATISSLATQDWGMWCCFIAAEYSIPQAGVRTALHRHSLFLLFQQIAQLACAVQAPSSLRWILWRAVQDLNQRRRGAVVLDSMPPLTSNPNGRPHHVVPWWLQDSWGCILNSEQGQVCHICHVINGDLSEFSMLSTRSASIFKIFHNTVLLLDFQL